MKTLLNGINEVLKKVSIINSNTLLTSLTNSGKQVFIDNAVQAWNEVTDQLYSKDDILRPYQGAEDSITLVAGTRTYGLPDDLIQLRWPLHEETQGVYIYEYEGGYEELRQILVQPANYTGQPLSAAISPIEKELFIDMIPTSTEAGYKYTFLYWRDTVLERATDQFPFDDGVFRAMVPAVVEVYKLNQTGTSTSINAQVQNATFKASFGRALRMVKQAPANRTYIKRFGRYQTGPLGHDPFVQ